MAASVMGQPYFSGETALQRILARGEIESLDHVHVPRLQQPNKNAVFMDRAARLRQLAPDNPLSDYLLLMANLVDAQHKVAKDRKSTRLNSSHVKISYAVFCLK